MKENLIFAGGFYNIFFAVFHLLFWKLFKWKTQLPLLTPLNKGVMEVMNVFLIITFLIFAAVSFLHTHELLTTPLGRTILISISLFWFLRAIAQLVFFTRKTILTWILLLIFFIGSILYGVPAMPALDC